MRVLLITVSLFAMAACAPQVPDSAAGVGFDNYDGYQAQRDAELSGNTQATLPAPDAVSSESLDAAEAPQAAPAARPVGISDEQDFGAVAGRESIESDAARIAAQRAQYVQIEPEDLPSRSGERSGPSIISYALSTSNQVGDGLYRRGGIASDSRFMRNCGKYTSADQAQQDFLSRGGPKRDTKGLDPDGDGFACYWDPTPFRQARTAAAVAPAVLPVSDGATDGATE